MPCSWSRPSQPADPDSRYDPRKRCLRRRGGRCWARVASMGGRAGRGAVGGRAGGAVGRCCTGVFAEGPRVRGGVGDGAERDRGIPERFSPIAFGEKHYSSQVATEAVSLIPAIPPWPADRYVPQSGESHLPRGDSAVPSRWQGTGARGVVHLWYEDRCHDVLDGRGHSACRAG